MRDTSCNIVIGGEAGQGLVTVGHLLAMSLVRHGYSIVVTQGYESRIRGGHNTYAIRVSDSKIEAPKEEIDILVALDEKCTAIHKKDMSSNGVVVIDVSYVSVCDRCIKVPYKEISPKRAQNVAALGIVSSLLRLDKNIVGEVVKDSFGKKGQDVIDENVKTLSSAFNWFSSQRVEFKPPARPEASSRKLLMAANDAVALGAMSAGIKFFSFYPMTPATGVGLMLAANAKKMGIVVEQAEDEIAAINMAIGASFAGAPSMVATSGGGFALMTEGVSLAAMTETPVVIVVGQRPAPATGLPTRTEQADLEFVLHSGHGEFPRAIFAPASVEDCFHLTREAFFLAEASQGPVFILTDQFIADSYRAVAPFDIENLDRVYAGISAADAISPYRRFALTDNGISPRLLPGICQHLVVADSDEHTEDGHLTEDLAIRKLMVEKRLKKLTAIKARVVQPSYFGDDKPDVMFVAWGSTAGSVKEAAEVIRSSGKKTAVLAFSQVWPLIPSQFEKYLRAAKEVISVEGNATGQFARLIRREIGFEIKKRILRYDGLPITPEYILKWSN